ncbi:MAG TPA: T9SS type A sorting domain-containing protein, partial [Flavobacteriales bacterium]|nr:T9SS type A sorting domain-containing protein [Flavobacteriales bacterium]
GLFTSLATVNGNPAIANYDYFSNDVVYVRATNTTGTTWGSPVTVHSTGIVGYHTELMIANARPAIAFYDYTNADMKIVQSSDANGTAWPAPTSIQTTGNVGQYISTITVSGNPAVAYHDATKQQMVFCRSNDVNGLGWTNFKYFDGNANRGTFNSTTLVNGNPAITYRDLSNIQLRYVRALDAQGTTWGTPVSLDTLVNAGVYSSLAMVNGKPAIAYQDNNNYDVKYIRATDANGTTWGTPMTLVSTGNVGQFVKMMVVNGNPAIAYYDGTNGDLKFIRATNADGTAWGAPITLDATGNVGQHISMLLVNGNPAIAYHDYTNTDLKYVRATNADGSAWGAPVTVVSTVSNVGQFSSLCVVNNNPAIAYYNASSIDLYYVRATDINGTAWGAPLVIDNIPLTSSGQYANLLFNGSTPIVVYYEYNNSDLKSIKSNDVNGTSWGAPQTVYSTGRVGEHASALFLNDNTIGIAYYDASHFKPYFIGQGCNTPAAPTNTTPAANLTICENNATTLTVSGSGTIGWYTASSGGTYLGGGSSYLTGTLFGSLTVYAQDSACTASLTRTAITVTVNDAPTVTLDPSSALSLSCNGDSNGEININVTAGSGASSIMYSWNAGTFSTEDISGLGAGTYALIATNNLGCSDSETYIVTEPTAISMGALTITHASCHGSSDGEIELIVGGGTVSGTYNYNWNSGMYTTEDLSGVPAGSYTVVVTDDNACTASQSFTITQPTAISIGASTTNTSCNGSSDGAIDLTVSGGTVSGTYTYNWNAGAFSTQDLSGLAAGAYSVVVTDDNACFAMQTYNLTEPTAISMGASTTNATCNGLSDGTIDLTVSGGTASGTYTYNWNSGAFSTEDLSGVPAGTYNVIVTDDNACSAVQMFTVTEPAPISIGASTTNATCNGFTDGAIDLTVSGGTVSGVYIYNWNSGAFITEDLSGLPAGTYTVVVTDDNACSMADAFTISEPLPINTSVTTTLNTISCVNISADVYQWIDCSTNAPLAGETAANFTASVNGDYAVIVTEAVCSDTSVCTSITGLGISPVTPDNRFNVFPNPTTGKIMISGGNFITVTLSDAAGKTLFTETQHANHFDLGTYAPGFYSVTIVSSDGKQQTLKLIKQ